MASNSVPVPIRGGGGGSSIGGTGRAATSGGAEVGAGVGMAGISSGSAAMTGGSRRPCHKYTAANAAIPAPMSMSLLAIPNIPRPPTRPRQLATFLPRPGAGAPPQTIRSTRRQRPKRDQCKHSAHSARVQRRHHDALKCAYMDAPNCQATSPGSTCR